jgi:3-deoxy-D-manno-octulosonic acid (KDO) 8-phosphate synthase
MRGSLDLFDDRVDGLFLEVHEEPSRARSDAQNALRLDLLEPLLQRLMAIDAIVKRQEQTLAAPGAVENRG